jgi:hypothetical protein
MQSITTVDSLHDAIVALESRRRDQERVLAGHLTSIYDSLKPVNIIKNAIRNLSESADVQYGALGLVSGYILKKIFVRSESGPWKKILGTALQFGLTILVGKKGQAFQSGGSKFLRNTLVEHSRNGSR